MDLFFYYYLFFFFYRLADIFMSDTTEKIKKEKISTTQNGTNVFFFFFVVSFSKRAEKINFIFLVFLIEIRETCNDTQYDELCKMATLRKVKVLFTIFLHSIDIGRFCVFQSNLIFFFSCCPIRNTFWFAFRARKTTNFVSFGLF